MGVKEYIFVLKITNLKMFFSCLATQLHILETLQFTPWYQSNQLKLLTESDIQVVTTDQQVIETYLK